MAEMLPAYLIAGTDTAKIEATRTRLRIRAEKEGGPAALEVFEPVEGRGMPNVDAVLASIPALSLTQSRRYLLVDGVERWKDPQIKRIAAALESLPPDLTLVLIFHLDSHAISQQRREKKKLLEKLQTGVDKAGGDVLHFDSPDSRDMPRLLVGEAGKRGFTLDLDAARILVHRIGDDSMRLGNELDKLALWAGASGRVDASDLEEMVSDSSEAVVWTLSDAILDRDADQAFTIAERLIAQGENLTGLSYGLASKMRQAHLAAERLEAGESPRQVEAGLRMHPYAARQLVSRLGRITVEDLRDATIALADLEVWSRGGADYGDELAFTLALRRAAGATS